MSAAIEVREVTHRYGERTEKGIRGLLDRITLHLSIGEAF